MRRFMLRTLLLATCLAPAFELQAETYYVDFTTAQFIPPDERDGSETKPFLAIAEAMDVATAGDTIIVKPESYTENVTLKAGVELRALHAASDPDTATDDKTVLLPADSSSPIVLVGNGNPAFDDTRTAVIGFMIMEGEAMMGAGVKTFQARLKIEDNEFIFNEAIGANPFGGAIAIEDQPANIAEGDYHVTIRHNAFVGNTALAPEGGLGVGGGIACKKEARTPVVLIEENAFVAPVPGFENKANRGGAVHFQECNGALRGNIIARNVATDLGGGIHIGPAAGTGISSKVAITDNFIVENGAGAGGGAFLRNSEIDLDGNVIELNTATSDGGGVLCDFSVCVFGAEASNSISFNSAGGSGGGVFLVLNHAATVFPPRSRILDNLFEENSAGAGGGEGHGGGLFCKISFSGDFPPADLEILGAKFLGNSAHHGGGIMIETCSTELEGLTLESNSARGDGGGLHCDGAVCALTSKTDGELNVFDSNSADASGGGAAFFEPRTGSAIKEAVFSNNTADADENGSGDGGGIYVFAADSTPVVLPIIGQFGPFTSEITSNTAWRGGGLALDGAHARVRMIQYRVDGNNAEQHGGGGFVGSGAGLYLSSDVTPKLPPAFNDIFGNAAKAAGGGIYIDDGASLLSVGNMIGSEVEAFPGNRVETGDGGGLWASPGARVEAWLNCFAGNSSDRGAGFFGGDSSGQSWLKANTFYINQAGPNGGAAFLANSGLFGYNAVLENENGGVTCDTGSDFEIRDNAMQGNEPFDFDTTHCDSGTRNVTGPVTLAPGFYGAWSIFPECGAPVEWDEAAMPGGDFGDAPDNTRGDFLAGYRGEFSAVKGRFPTYYESDNAPAGRTGQVHVFPPLFALGPLTGEGLTSVSNDRGAESAQDDDMVPNLDSSTLTPDQDALEDGWEPRRLEPCSEETLEVRISADAMLARLAPEGMVAYLNVAADWTHGGTWGSAEPGGSEPLCPENASEWAVQNLEVELAPGGTVTVSPTVQTGSTGDVWMRLSLSESPLDPPGGDWDGSAPAPGWLFGETEDFLVCVGDNDAACAQAVSADVIFQDRFSAPPD